MNRSFGYVNNNRSSYDFSWRNSSSLQDQQRDRKILDLIEKIRNCKPYLQKRLKIIEESGQLKLLREEVQDITYWLEIAQEVRADLIYGVETLEVVHEKMMDMIRLHPIQGTFPASRVERISDDDSDSAPRSPSPGVSGNDFASSTKIIPLEQSSQSKHDWARSKAPDFLPNNVLPTDRRPPDRGGYDPPRGDVKFGNDWNAAPPPPMEYSRRDTDMRLETGARFDGFHNGRMAQQPPRDTPRFEDPRSGAANSVWSNNNADRSPWDPYRGGGGPRGGGHTGGDRSDENLRDYDYRDRVREPSPDRTRFPAADRRMEEEQRGRQFFRDQDFRDLSRSNSRDDRSRDRHDENRNRSNERDWRRLNERPCELPVTRIYRDRENRDVTDQRRFGSPDNRDQWSTPHGPPGVNAFNNGNAGPVGMPPNSVFMLNQPRMSMSPHEMGIMSPQNVPSTPAVGIVNRGGLSQPGNLHQNSVSQCRNSIGMGPQSPPQFSNSFAPHPPQRPALLPTPAARPAPTNFNMPYQSTNNNNQPAASRPQVGASPYDPRVVPTDFVDQFRQKAQQHFSKQARTRPPPVTTRSPTTAPTVPSKPPLTTTTAGSNSVANPNLATNQIAADLPSDPRRRSQLQRLMQQQQQQQQKQQSQSIIAPGDPRHRRSSPSPNNIKDNTINKESSGDGQGTSSKNDSEPSPRNTKRSSSSTSSELRDSSSRDREHGEPCKNRNIQELRKTLSRQGFHKLGTKSKNFEEASSPEPEDKRVDEKEGRRKSSEDGKRKGDTSPTRAQLPKSSPKDSNSRRSERVTRGKDPKTSVSADDEEKECRRRSVRTRKSSEDDKRFKKHSISEDDEKEVKGKNVAKAKNPDDSVIPQKSVSSFRIPKIKRREPTPPPPPPTPPPLPEESPLVIDLDDDDDDDDLPQPSSSPHADSPPGSPEPASSKDALVEDDNSESQRVELNTHQLGKLDRSATETSKSEKSKLELEKSQTKKSDTTTEKNRGSVSNGSESLAPCSSDIPDRKTETASNKTEETTTKSTTVQEEGAIFKESVNSTDATTPKPGGITENLAASTDFLLRQFMAKSVGLPEDVLEQIVSNPNAMDKIKSLLKSHVTEIVGSEPTSSPVRTESHDDDRVDERKVAAAAAEEEETPEESRAVLESPLPQDEGEFPTRGRSSTRKRSHKRRSSLEKLHDALREMNFDAVLPLGPRRAANARSHGEETEATTSNSVAESIQSVIDNVVSEASVEADKSEDDNNEPSESMTTTAEDVVPVKKGLRGRKRKGGITASVPKKRGRKPASIIAVSAKAAIAAVAAIPDAEVLARSQVVESTVAPPQPSPSSESPASASKRKGRKSAPKASEPTKSPAKVTRSTRLLPDPGTEVRITRSMIKPAAAVSTEPILEVNAEPATSTSTTTTTTTTTITTTTTSTVEEEKPSPEDIPITPIPEAPRPARPRQYKGKKKSEQPAVPPPPVPVVSSPPSPSVIKKEPVEEIKPDPNQHVFVYDEDTIGFNPLDVIPSHDKLLSDDAGASIVISRVCPETFDEFLRSFGKQEPDSSEGQRRNCGGSISHDRILAECKEALEWMVSVVQFREKSDEKSPDFDLSDLDGPVPPMLDIFRANKGLLLSLDMDEDDNGDDEEDEEDEDLDDGGNSSSVPNNTGESTRMEDDSQGVTLDDDVSNKIISVLNSQDSDDVFSKDDLDERDSDPHEEDDADSGRTRNLSGPELYQCANRGCGHKAPNGALFKDHALNCNLAEDSRNLLCFHCERRLKSIQSLMEHLKIHGKPRQFCSLCSFQGWFNSELSKHLKNVHKVYNCKVVTEGREDEDPVYITYPKGVAGKLALPTDLTQNHVLYTSKVQFQPTDIDSVPKNSIFTSLVHCALCDYSTKVRSNIVRHLELHGRSEKDGGATKVPSQAPVNPVPCLERKELMFDKMTNWAGSSHANKVGGVSKEDTLKLPKFVVDQFRYVCSVSSCKQVTGQDDILCAHMKALHFKEKYYVCPHCHEEEGTKDDLRNTVLIEKIPHHLKLHGPRLSKCGHCDYIHFSSASMEKHVATKHVEKKPIFYLIRDLDSEGNTLASRRTSVDDPSKGPHERWRCTLCRAQLNCWDEAKAHCSLVHKISSQFECSVCHYGSDSIYAISSHISNKECKPDKREPKVMIMFLRGENFESNSSESKNEEGINVPIWRRGAPRVKHIRGIFLDDENVRPSASSSRAPVPKPVSANSSLNTSPATTPKTPAASPLLICPKCNLFKAKSAKDLKIHLFNELNYERYKCTICDVRCVTINSLRAHMNIDHKAVLDNEEKSLLPANKKIENQVYEMISSILNAQKTNVEEKDGRNIENLLCKHCYLQFSSFHNYRTHVLAKHIGSERFKCKHCNAGFWHEAMVKQHHFKSSHANLPFSVVRDLEFEQMLTPEFWFKEYGIPHNKSVTSASVGRPGDEMGSSSPVKYSTASVTGTDSSSSGAVKRSLTSRRSMSGTSDTDKEDVEMDDPLKLTSSPKRPAKHLKELSNVYKCEHCLITNFTKRGMRSHWSRSHGMEELPCRYYECRSFDDNLKLNDGYVLKCSTCTFQTSSVEHYQSHHEEEHPGKAYRYKRRKRNDVAKSTAEVSTVVVCSYCYCELETVKKFQVHCQQKHPGYPLEYKLMEVQMFPQQDQGLTGAKLIEDNVVVECPACSKSCGSLKQYVSHFSTHHESLAYTDPVIRFSRVYSGNEEPDAVEAEPSRPKLLRRALPSSDQQQQQQQQGPAEVLVKKSNQPSVLYECPKCEFKSDNLEYLCSSHLITHLLTYRCPECNLAFHLFLDAQFHIRHFHGIPRIQPSHNADAYVEFSALKDRITQVSVAPRKSVILVNLSDDEDFDDTPTAFPIPNPDDLDELDVEDVRMLLE